MRNSTSSNNDMLCPKSTLQERKRKKATVIIVMDCHLADALLSPIPSFGPRYPSKLFQVDRRVCRHRQEFAILPYPPVVKEDVCLFVLGVHEQWVLVSRPEMKLRKVSGT